MLSKRFAVFAAIGALSCTASHASSECTDGLPVVEFAVKISDINEAGARTALCDETNVLCNATDIVAQFDAGTTTLSYDDGNNWQVKKGDTVVLTTAGYKLDSNDYALTTAVTELQLVDLAALNTQLNASATVTNCGTTFTAALDAYTALQTFCEEAGNKNQDERGACADTCVTGYEYVIDVCVPAAYVDTTSGTQEDKANAKKAHMQNVRHGGAKKRGTETDDDFKKRQFKEMKANTRAYLKSQFDTAKIANDALPQGQKVKPHVLRKQLRMPLSIAADSEDFKPAFIETLRTKFGLGSGQDRDVGIIVGPVNTASPEACATWLSSTDDKSDFDDEDKCITYDAAIDGATTDVHVLGNDDSYSVGGLLIGGKYEPVVKQKVAVLTDETFEVSCWSGDAWTAQDKDAGAGGTQHWAAGDEVKCTVTKGGVVTVVDTIVGSLTTGQVDGDKCDVGYGCARKSEDPTSADYLVCADTFACEPCASPEANNAVDATVCAAQLCAAGTGYDAASVSFDTSLDPTVTNNDNCKECDTGTYNTGGNGQCVDYTECTGTTYFDPDHTSKTADRSCLPKTQCTIAVHCNDRGSTAGYIKPDETCTCNCDTSGYDGDKCQTDIATPVFSSSSTAQAINENSGAGQLVYTATATDNSGGVVTFSLSGTDASAFDISGGEVTLTADPDFEAQSSYSFTVVATDAAGNSADQAVTLAIKNVDEVTCGRAQGADGKAIKTAGTPEADTVCCDSADNDDICDYEDTCFINGCTNTQLTDAYATLEAAAGSDCENSRRAQDHTKVFETCYTTGCTTESQMQAMVDKFGTCSAQD